MNLTLKLIIFCGISMCVFSFFISFHLCLFNPINLFNASNAWTKMRILQNFVLMHFVFSYFPILPLFICRLIGSFTLTRTKSVNYLSIMLTIFNHDRSQPTCHVKTIWWQWLTSRTKNRRMSYRWIANCFDGIPFFMSFCWFKRWKVEIKSDRASDDDWCGNKALTRQNCNRK